MIGEKSSKKKLHCIILAAGMGTRMVSNKSKVLHEVSGVTMVEIVLNLARNIAQNITVVASQENADAIQVILSGQSAFECGSKNRNEEVVIQHERLGTGHAVLQAVKSVQNSGAENVLVLYADTPLITNKTLNNITQTQNDVTFLGFCDKTPNKYGRLIAEGENLTKIVEYKDASPQERNATLCNSGVVCVNANILMDFLHAMKPSSVTGEYYLTDLAKHTNDNNKKCGYILCDKSEVQGVNSRVELATVDATMQERIKTRLMENGVTIVMPHTTYICLNVQIGRDVTIYPNCFLGNGVKIGEGVDIHSFSHLEDCTVESGASVGPFARIRPNTILKNGVRIGNFVEVKNSTIGENSKANHLAYIGDCNIHQNCNIGAGTVFCNYDGFNKFHTEVGSGSFVGSNSTIVSPVNIAEGTIVGAGSVVTMSTKKDDLIITRAEEKAITNGAMVFRNKRAKKKSV